MIYLEICISTLMEFCYGLGQVEGTEGTDVLVACFVVIYGVHVVMLSWRDFVKNYGGPQDGNPWPKFIDFVCTAKGVIIDQTVGLSKPINLEAPEIDFIPCY